MDDEIVRRARERLAAERTDPAAVDAALERARKQLAALAQTTAELEATLPRRVGDAIQDGIREEVLPVARHFAEVRGLTSQVLRRLERIEGEQSAERHARVDDLALLVELVASGWSSVDERLGRLEERLFDNSGGAVLYRLESRKTS